MKKLFLIALIMMSLVGCETQQNERWDNQFVFYNPDNPDTLLINKHRLSFENAVKIPNDTLSNYYIESSMNTDGILEISFYRESAYDIVSTDAYEYANSSESQPWIDEEENLKTIVIPPDRLNDPVFEGHYYFMVSQDTW